MTVLADAIDGMDPDARDACMHRVATAIDGCDAPVVMLACLYFAFVAVMRLSGNLDELIDDLPRLARSVIDSQVDTVTRQ